MFDLGSDGTFQSYAETVQTSLDCFRLAVKKKMYCVRVEVKSAILPQGEETEEFLKDNYKLGASRLMVVAQLTSELSPIIVLKLSSYNRESYFVLCPSLVGDDAGSDAHCSSN